MSNILRFPPQFKPLPVAESEQIIVECTYCGCTEFNLWLDGLGDLTSVCTECGK
jgi:hypothetical protein